MARHSIGVELNPKYVALTHERMKNEIEPSRLGTIEYNLFEGDIRETLSVLADKSVDFIITSPPYWGILNKIDHKAKQERLMNGYDHNYGWDKADLAQIKEYSDFVDVIGQIFDDLARALSKRRYLVVIVGDFRHKQKYYMLHSDLAAAIEKRGNFELKGITIIYQKFKRVFPYGYPYSYVPNIHHQYALVFQKNK